MLDNLDRGILEVIDNAPSILRSVSKREIEAGVLFPSLTTVDIKRNLPNEIDLNVIEGRLNALKNEGYIYFESNRWWLTQRGKGVLGRDSPSVSYRTSISKPMRKVLEETFSSFESPRKKPSQNRELLNRKRELLREIGELEKKLVQKRLELEEINKTISGE
jgi:hypothetical protein